VEALYVVTTGQVSFLRYLTDFFVPTLLGNIVGGVSLVAALNYAQVTTPRRTRR
jgi:formate/nitrite transporter FocA (FNT family)